MTQQRPQTYNVPLSLLDDYKGHRVIVRFSNPSEVTQLTEQQLHNVAQLQLLDASADVQPIVEWSHGLPIEVVLQHPDLEAAKLYRIVKLQRAHPLRIVIPVVPGFSKAVKVASALQLPVKLEGNQPGQEVIDELCSTLEFFLHQKTVAQSIDYFSGLLSALIHEVPLTLWDLQDEDPSALRYVTDDGREVLARTPYYEDKPLDYFRDEFLARVMSPDIECSSCEFFSSCGGYFKWPDASFSCHGIKQVLRALTKAAQEIQKDLTEFSLSVGGRQ